MLYPQRYNLQFKLYISIFSDISKMRFSCKCHFKYKEQKGDNLICRHSIVMAVGYYEFTILYLEYHGNRGSKSSTGG